MQFFPADITSSDAVSIGFAASSANRSDSGENFGNVFSSFIEEDRYDYSGRPAGFSAYGPDSGTIDNKTAASIAKKLRERNVADISISQLEALAASGTPMTIGTVFNALSGKTRLTENLGDAELESFKLALNKLDFSTLESEEMLGMSQNGDTRGMWSLLSGKLQNVDGTVNLNQKEMNGLLKGLDASAANRKNLLKFFQGDSGELETRELSGADLEKMLATVRGEFAEREQAAAFAGTQARGAIVASLEAAKLEKNNAAVDNARGTRRLEQKEALMQKSIREHTGVDQIKDGNAASQGGKRGFEGDDQIKDGNAASQDGKRGFVGDDQIKGGNTASQDGKRGFEDNDQIKDGNAASQGGRRGFEGDDGKSRSERILSTIDDYRPLRKNVEGEKSVKTEGENPKTAGSADKLLQNVHVAADAVRPEQSAAPQGQNLNDVARSYRQEIFSQVEQGILSGTQNGSNRLALQLNPVELGQVTVILSMHQGEVKATIRAEQQGSADVLREQMAELKTALEAEGLKVKELDVQTGLNEDSAANQWDGHQEHNLMRDADERDRMMRLARIRRDAAGETGRGETLESATQVREQAGLHVVA